MSKRLPYFQFEPAEWLAGDIMFCSLSARGLFTDIMALYWQKECELTLDQVKRRFNCESELEELISENIIKVDNDNIIIEFLYNQLVKAIGKSKVNSEKVFELNRLCVYGEIEIQLSKFVAWCLNELKLKDLILVSYADTQMNHNGYIYQATNWIYTGLTKQRTDKYVEGNKHSRHYDNDNQKGLRKYRSAKHRYIYFATNKNKRKEYISKLKYNIEKYPKGKNSNYILGEFIKPIILNNEKTNNIL